MISNVNGHSPLPSNVYLSESPIHGTGVFAKEPIEPDHDFGITHVADDRFPNGYIRTSFGGFINHSFTPNCKVVEVEDTLHIVATHRIEKGTELTLDYRPYYTASEVAKYT